ncbi:MAG: helix-turn-helix domain-containing protein [Alphaproteobacteria bacterium]|jgi:excisionase family DNA binding protein|nr:helix-turn-helix domain-containing protein [Alphaproteobacteria bacterium]MBU1552321.1 helix-turn-helix domain-containing protein [Alphaproteobacteria bacterium]MBU2334514.1 helix-turn-helix domain-containing protein [Alphaproteobacteria bacterium]MBU2386370.1 helix-turn-helix domain-containing protein [Alphaproteobacteria bacterium]
MTDDPGKFREKLLTLKDVAEILAISERTVRDFVDAGAMPFVDIGHGRKRRLMRFLPADVDAFIDGRRKIARPSLPPRRVTPAATAAGAVDFLDILAKRKADQRRRSGRK